MVVAGKSSRREDGGIGSARKGVVRGKEKGPVRVFDLGVRLWKGWREWRPTVMRAGGSCGRGRATRLGGRGRGQMGDKGRELRSTLLVVLLHPTQSAATARACPPVRNNTWPAHPILGSSALNFISLSIRL